MVLAQLAQWSLPDTRGPRFDSSHRRYLFIYSVSTVYWKDENKEKEAANSPSLKTLMRPLYLPISILMLVNLLRRRGTSTVWPDWAIYCTLGNFSKPLATINLPKSPTFLGNFCEGVKIIHFSCEIILGNFYRHLAIFIWSHWSSNKVQSKIFQSNSTSIFVLILLIFFTDEKKTQNSCSSKFGPILVSKNAVSLVKLGSIFFEEKTLKLVLQNILLREKTFLIVFLVISFKIVFLLS